MSNFVRLLRWAGRWQRITGIAAFAAAALLVRASDQAGLPDPTLEVYRAVAELRFNEAASLLDATPLDAVEPRLAHAIATLNRQPRTAGNVQRATAILETVARSEPATSPSLTARFLLARITQFHGPAPDHAGALSLFEALWREHPDHPLGQLALLKATPLRIYRAGGPAAAQHQIESLSTLVPGVSDPVIRANLHFVIGDACTRLLHAPELAALHLRRAAELGLAQRDVQMNTLVRAAEWARRSGDSASAAALYRRFLDEYPREIRQQRVRERLAEVEHLATHKP